MKPGDPRPPFEWEEFEKLCAMGATLTDVAHWFGCSTGTVESRVKEKYGCLFKEQFDKLFVKTRMSLRRMQVKLALEGNGTMLVWLGKQFLGQSNNLEISGPGGKPIPVAAITVSTDPKDAARAYAQMVKGID